MQKQNLLLFLFLISFQLFAQKPDTKYGSISPNEIALKSYPIDTLADAVVLCEWGKYTYDYYFWLELTHYKRIKILKESGLKNATQSVEYNNNSQRLDDVYATVNKISADGKLTKIDIDKKYYHESNIVNNLNKFTITFPDVHVGDIIEFKYTVYYKTFRMPQWNFEDDLPTVYSEISIETSQVMQYSSIATGMNISRIKKEQHESQNDVGTASNSKYNDVKIFSLTDLPSIKYEPMARSKYQDWDKIIFFPRAYGLHKISFDTWKELVKDLYESYPEFYNQLHSTSEMNTYLNESGLKDFNKPKLERMVGIQKLVSKSIHWDGTYSMWSNRGVEEAFKRREGNSADVNFILLCLLKEAGLKPKPILLSTRARGGFYTDIPILQMFDHVMAMVKIDSVDYVLDATSSLPYYMLPLQCNDVDALLADPDDPMLFFINCMNDYNTTNKVNIEVEPDGKQQVKTVSLLDEYSKMEQLDYFKKNDKDEWVKNIFSKQTDFQLDSFSIKNDNFASSQPLEIKIAYSSEATNSSKMYIEPFSFTKFENPFTAEKRVSAIDLGAKQNKTYFSAVQIPADYKFEQTLKELNFWSNDSSMQIQRSIITNEANLFRIKTDIIINKSYFPASQYADLKKFYEQAASSFNEKIIITKK